LKAGVIMRFHRCHWMFILLALAAGLLLALVLPPLLTVCLLIAAVLSLWLWNCRR